MIALLASSDWDLASATLLFVFEPNTNILIRHWLALKITIRAVPTHQPKRHHLPRQLQEAEGGVEAAAPFEQGSAVEAAGWVSMMVETAGAAPPDSLARRESAEWAAVDGHSI